ncbi:hypothetical protein [Lactobacillus plantarum] [Lactiplantibacillus mudanjiangensis]|uniref:hypothetical protein n=1 Tax=Lactiplantibacillus mudanjiangensis TaxID=1296538 RepID=UPI001014E41C|nr:hypothetical protein [Lactobacillus plantarum] [Lactiplantibacillus mudanjiangensis]
MEPVVGYYISSVHHLPTITIDGESVWVVSCTYQYVTSNGQSLSGTNMVTATIIKHGEHQQHVVTINQNTHETWYQ